MKPAIGTVSLHRGQLRAWASTAKIQLLVGGIRSGKTHYGALKTILRAISDRPCKIDECHAICSPTYPMSTVPVEKIFSLLQDETIFPQDPLIRYYKRDRMFIFRNVHGGVGRVRVFSMHDFNKSRGFKWRSAWYDEGAYGDSGSWDIVQGRVADSNGDILITTTPDGYNWVYEVYEKAREERSLTGRNKVYSIIHFTSLDNTFIENKDGLHRLVEGYDEKTYNQEVMARFVRDSGFVYYPFSDENIRHGEFDPRKELWVGQDFNVANMASVMGQPFITGDGSQGLHILGDRLAKNSDTPDVCVWLAEFCARYKYPRERVTIFPDASGRSRSTSGKTDFEILKKAGFRVSAPLANPFIRDRVNTMNSLIKPRFMRARRLLVDPRAVNVLETLRKQPWADTDPPTPDKKLGLDHIGDALGYMVCRKFPLRGGVELGFSREGKRAA